MFSCCCSRSVCVMTRCLWPISPSQWRRLGGPTLTPSPLWWQTHLLETGTARSVGVWWVMLNPPIPVHNDHVNELVCTTFFFFSFFYFLYLNKYLDLFTGKNISKCEAFVFTATVELCIGKILAVRCILQCSVYDTIYCDTVSHTIDRYSITKENIVMYRYFLTHLV